LLEQQLNHTGAYVAGADFSLADVLIGLSAHRWRQTPMERPDYPAVAAYCKRLEQRPGFAEYASDAYS
jgi:glutathione S-transferase